jgi:hypothetical protein
MRRSASRTGKLNTEHTIEHTKENRVTIKGCHAQAWQQIFAADIAE